MRLLNKNGIPYYNFDLLAGQPRLKHGVFTNTGADGNVLNMAFSGQAEDDARANQALAADSLGFEALFRAGQVHGDKSVVAEKAAIGNERIQYLGKGYDALITRDQGLGLLITLADCQGVILHDPGSEVLALVHNGWRGSVTNILGKTVSRLEQEFGADPATMLAGISPSLGPCCAEFINHTSELPESFMDYHVGNAHFDFWAISQSQLTQAGLKAENIELAGICTVCSDEFFSYRKDKTTNRFGLAAGLE